ncbi:methyltransferase family protein [Sulfobacillus harzensis]|uniref:Isoprenylcysteine carboxylmethyltransferase family protein n=1 Tax=Sulfobacillus harzensis TaxID=2729629 RepID=A0A7Y0L264_9FIRM|nr:isoprenylcysteine carboxylmethyltransferase family protein [Sulfobacillus harzensis]NMP21923.1 isoprenylcysteine carboxylmethyltransferase family protein [Sulfobacillus harzensis]
MKKIAHSPGVIAPPPLLYLGGLAFGYAFHWLIPWRPFNHTLVLGLVLIALGIAIALWAVGVMARAKTPVDPSRSPTHLVREGPFRWSRNPIYLSMTTASLGAALALNNGWIIVWLIPVLVTMHYGVIIREEQFLSDKFGDTYREYLRRVRRWL